MNTRLFKFASALVFSLGLSGNASALAMLGIEPPASLIVAGNDGSEWVWGAPCAPVDPSCGVVQLHHGFAIPSLAEWTAGWLDLAELVAAFVDPELCASPFFSTAHDHCDGSDVVAGFVWGAPFANELFGGSVNAGSEAFLTRNDGNPIPEPASMALFGIGLLGAAAARRGRQA